MPDPFIDDDESWLDTRPDPAPPSQRTQDRLWVVHMSHHKMAAARGLAEGFICVGWVEAGDLSHYAGREALKAAFNRHYPGHKPGCVSNWAGDALRFVFDMNPGHLFVFPVTGGDHVHIGEVTGDYCFRGDDAELVASDSASVHPVKWLGTVNRASFSKAALLNFDSEHTVHSGDPHRDEVLAVLATAQSNS